MLEISSLYYAVIFTSVLQGNDPEYHKTTERLERLAAKQTGFLGFETARNNGGFGISISYWQDLQSIHDWRDNLEHQLAKKMGEAKWYKEYKVRIARVEHEY